MNKLTSISLHNFTTESAVQFKTIPLSYQCYGQELGNAPVVLVNHALTGNSEVCGKNGWWNALIGPDKAIDTHHFTILAFNIPGNGFDGFLIDNYHDFVAKDVARLFLLGLEFLNIKELFAIIGGSLGGGIAWEMAVLNPKITQHLIPIASDFKSTDWLIANCRIQEQFLNNSSQAVHDARMHAMLCYRTPASFSSRFNRTVNEELAIFNVESWLLHHGKKLQERFQLAAYKLMNHLLKNIDAIKAAENTYETLNKIESNILIIGVDSDLFFTSAENRETYTKLSKLKANISYQEIISIHGHDAFLIEFTQLSTLISPIFNTVKLAHKTA